MSDVINRTTLALLKSVSTPRFPTATWIINPDLSAVLAVPKIYWKIVGDDVLEMTQPEKDAVDAVILADRIASVKAVLKRRTLSTPGDDIITNVAISGLMLTASIDVTVVGDETEVTADPTDTTFVKLVYLYDTVADTFTLKAFVRVNGQYDEPPITEKVVVELGEWSVGAGGTVLVKV